MIFSSDSEDVISSEEMDKENIKKLENQTDIRFSINKSYSDECGTFYIYLEYDAFAAEDEFKGYPHIFCSICQ